MMKRMLNLLTGLLVFSVAQASDSLKTVLFFHSGISTFRVDALNSAFVQEGVPAVVSPVHLGGGIGLLVGLNKIYLETKISRGSGLTKGSVNTNGTSVSLGLNYAFLNKNKLQLLGGINWSSSTWTLTVSYDNLPPHKPNRVFVLNSSTFYGLFNHITPSITLLYNLSHNFVVGLQLGYDFTYKYNWTYPNAPRQDFFQYFPQGLTVRLILGNK
ncbi:MAG: hypothetical protein GXO48_04970 [Chlorobi bacterium]|nr:hypothetical protein [Chlorobiota bacterium]